jgi:hypothetical protein
MAEAPRHPSWKPFLTSKTEALRPRRPWSNAPEGAVVRGRVQHGMGADSVSPPNIARSRADSAAEDTLRSVESEQAILVGRIQGRASRPS